MINDLTIDKPRSPKEVFKDLVALPRLCDKLRARANNKLGEFKTGETSELDRQLLNFLSNSNNLLENFENVFSSITPTTSDEEIFNLIESAEPNLPSEEKRKEWSEKMLNMKFIDDPDRTAYAKTLIEKMNLDPNITTFDFLEI